MHHTSVRAKAAGRPDTHKHDVAAEPLVHSMSSRSDRMPSLGNGDEAERERLESNSWNTTGHCKPIDNLLSLYVHIYIHIYIVM